MAGILLVESGLRYKGFLMVGQGRSIKIQANSGLAQVWDLQEPVAHTTKHVISSSTGINKF